MNSLRHTQYARMMLRSVCAAIASTWSSFSGTVATPAQLPLTMPAPGFLYYRLEGRQGPDDGPSRLYYYRISHARNSMEFSCKYRGDLFGYNITANALDKALTHHIKTLGPIREKWILLNTGDWRGLFVVDENTEDATLILTLIDTADTRLHKELH